MIRWLRNFLAGGSETLQEQLATLVTMAVVSAVAITSGAAYALTYFTIYSQLDGELIGIARLTSQWISGDVENLGGLNSDALSTANVSVAVVRSDNTMITPSGNIPLLELSPSEIAIARTQLGTSSRNGVNSEDVNYRIVAVPFTDDGAHYAVIVGRPLENTDRIITTLGISLVTFGVAAIIVSGFVGSAVARSGLQPIRKLTKATREVVGTDSFKPLEVEGLGEFTELISAFNTMMHTLEASRTQQQRLIADAGHELRTPLTSLRTNIELLIADDRQGMLPPEVRSEILKDVVASLGEFTTLIGDLVHLSREESTAPAKKTIDLADIVESALERAKRRGQNLHFDVHINSWYVTGEPESLERAITNLLDNAIKFSPAEGTVSIRVERDRLKIWDEGLGIDDDDLPHIFDRFYRSDKSRTTPGTGLGLAIVAQIIKAHGGWVRAGRAVTGGAEFTVRLPGTPTPPDADT